MLHRLRSPDLADRAPAVDFASIRTELEVPGPFPPTVEAAAAEAVRSPSLPATDATDLDLVTIDPPGSRDLDQAVGIEERPGGGWRVHYAIADVAAWVRPGSPVDAEARARTQTYYAPDERTPLHPPVLGEGAASLLPDGPRPAALWTIDVEADGTAGEVVVRRAMVRSRAQLSYPEVDRALADGTAPPCLQAFPAIGAALLAEARRRDAIELGLPEQQVVHTPAGGWTVELRADLPIEAWNAEISLLTGRSAAQLMLDAGVGILRTLPDPDPAAFPRLRRAARSLHIDWPDSASPGAVLAGLDPSQPRHAAFADLAAELLRGAGYTVVDATTASAGTSVGHAGVGAPYAHVTAPLRRLVDRFATEVCLAVAAGRPVPEWALAALSTLPDAMAEGDRRAHKLDRAVVDATEAVVLAERVGEVFEAAVIETGDRYGTVVLEDPPVRGRCDSPDLPLGADISVRCTRADVEARTVRFERVT